MTCLSCHPFRRRRLVFHSLGIHYARAIPFLYSYLTISTFTITLSSFYSYLYCKVYTDSLLLLTDVCMNVCVCMYVPLCVFLPCCKQLCHSHSNLPKGFLYSLLNTVAPPLGQLKGTNHNYCIYLLLRPDQTRSDLIFTRPDL